MRICFWMLILHVFNSNILACEQKIIYLYAPHVNVFQWNGSSGRRLALFHRKKFIYLKHVIDWWKFTFPHLITFLWSFIAYDHNQTKWSRGNWFHLVLHGYNQRIYGSGRQILSSFLFLLKLSIWKGQNVYKKNICTYSHS